MLARRFVIYGFPHVETQATALGRFFRDHLTQNSLLHAIAGAGEYAGAQILTLRFEQSLHRGGHHDVLRRALPPEAPEGSGTVDPDVTKCRPPFEACQYGSE